MIEIAYFDDRLARKTGFLHSLSFFRKHANDIWTYGKSVDTLTEERRSDLRVGWKKKKHYEAAESETIWSFCETKTYFDFYKDLFAC